MAPIPRLKSYSGPALLSYGFRPFFFCAAVYAGIGLLIWLPLFSGDLNVPTTFSPVDWHIHEMLYGYLPAVITGFLLTAIPNWTGRLPLQGRSLAILVAVWLAGRLAVSISAIIGPIAAGVIDTAFLFVLTAAVAREVVAGRNWRNLPPVLLVLVFFAGNVTFHIEDFMTGTTPYATRIGIAAAIALISLIGGRVIPSFTRNWLARENPGRLPMPYNRFDLAALVVTVIALAMWIFAPDWLGTAALMLLAGVLQAARLARWAGDRTTRDRLVLVLHVGYGFVPLGFFLLAGSILFPQDLPASAGIHAWTVGAIGTMTLAIMTRASLGHTGHALKAGLLTQALYTAVVIAAVCRIAAAFAAGASLPLLHAAGAAWIAAFWMFAAGYGTLLWRPRTR